MCLRVGDFAVSRVNLEISNGHCVAIVGPSGSGKTVLLKCIAGFHRPQTGEIWINGKNVTKLPPEKREVGYVPQEYALFPHLTVERNIEFGLKPKKIPNKSELVQEMMDLLGITDLAKRSIEALSGGEKQRVALARALVTHPKLLLLDEPLSSLDVRTRERLQKELKRIHEKIRSKFKITSVYVTHDLAEAYLMGDRIAIIDEGEIKQFGHKDEILRKPNSRFVAQFLGLNVLDGYVTSVSDSFAHIQVNETHIHGIAESIEKDTNVMVIIRPEDIMLSPEEEVQNPRWRNCRCNILEGSVTDIAVMMYRSRVTIDVGFPLTSEMSTNTIEEMNIDIGSRVFTQFKAASVSLCEKRMREPGVSLS